MTMENCDKPPPEKMFSMPRNSLPAKNCASRAWSMPGIGMAARERKIISTPKVKNIRLRKILSWKINRILLKKSVIIKLIAILFDASAGFLYRLFGACRDGATDDRDFARRDAD